MFDEGLVDLDHVEGQPVRLDPLDALPTSRQTDGANRLHVANPTHRPRPGILHRGNHQLAAILLDIALDESARIEVEHQRSSSRSDKTSPDAERPVPNGRGERLGRGRAAGVILPSATSLRMRSSPRRAAAGTMSATAFPCLVTLICSPSSTRCKTLLRLVFNSRMPI